MIFFIQVLHEGKLAEMRTGEGKTLVAVLPAYLNALEGKGVQVDPPPPPPPTLFPPSSEGPLSQYRATRSLTFSPLQEKISGISSPKTPISLSQSDSSSKALPLLHTSLGLSNRQGHPQGSLHDSTSCFRGAKRVQRKFHQTYGLEPCVPQ